MQGWWWVIQLREACMRVSGPSGIWIIKGVKSAVFKISDMVRLLSTLISPPLLPAYQRKGHSYPNIPVSDLEIHCEQLCSKSAPSTVSKLALGPQRTVVIQSTWALYHSLTAPHLKRFTLQCYVITTIRKKFHSVCDPDTYTRIPLRCRIYDLETCICHNYSHISDSRYRSQLYTLTYIWPTELQQAFY